MNGQHGATLHSVLDISLDDSVDGVVIVVSMIGIGDDRKNLGFLTPLSKISIIFADRLFSVQKIFEFLI